MKIAWLLSLLIVQLAVLSPSNTHAADFSVLDVSVMSFSFSETPQLSSSETRESASELVVESSHFSWLDSSNSFRFFKTYTFDYEECRTLECIARAPTELFKSGYKSFFGQYQNQLIQFNYKLAADLDEFTFKETDIKNLSSNDSRLDFNLKLGLEISLPF